MSASPISLIAPAKLTLSLQVTGTRDDGYHLIDAEMVTLDIADVLTVTPGEQGLSFDGPQAQGLTDSDDNLVSRALRQCGKQARVHIQKNIPHGGGLGGGSADAAAIFRWANYQDLEAASRIGADIPFCMVGGRARVRGIGEIIEPLPFVARSNHTDSFAIRCFNTGGVSGLRCSTPTIRRDRESIGSGSNGC